MRWPGDARHDGFVISDNDKGYTDLAYIQTCPAIQYRNLTPHILFKQLLKSGPVKYIRRNMVK